jgi:2-dehydro-3-deoxyphosphooctonate aldolase (KDO 8-P synthase)
LRSRKPGVDRRGGGKSYSLCKKHSIPYIFKASYKKANRTSASSFTGLGDDTALGMISKVALKYSLPCTTDIHSETEAALAAQHVDVLQIPAFSAGKPNCSLLLQKQGKL